MFFDPLQSLYQSEYTRKDILDYSEQRVVGEALWKDRYNLFLKFSSYYDFS